MSIYRNAYIFDNTVIFYYGGQKRKFTLYKENFDGTINICNKFDDLWWMLLNTEDFTYNGNPAPEEYNFPENNLSVLTGVQGENGFINWTSQTGFDGPITSDGYPLSLYQLGYSFELSWKADEYVNISFYTSYSNIGSDAYPIIDENNKLASYCDFSGTLRIYNTDYIYVRTDKKTNIKLTVKVVKPNEFIGVNLGTEYIHFTYEKYCYRFPVLTKTLSDDALTVSITVNDKLLTLQKEIQNTMRILAKKWPNEIISLIDPHISERIPELLTYFNVLNKGSPSTASSFTVKTFANTYNYVETDIFERDMWWFQTRAGSEKFNPTLGISIKPAFRQDKTLRLNFTIQLVNDPRWTPLSGIVVSAGRKIWSLNAGYEFVNYARFGKEITKTFFVTPGEIFSDFLDLPPGETVTTLTCVLTAIANSTFDITNAEIFRFLSVTLEYIG